MLSIRSMELQLISKANIFILYILQQFEKNEYVVETVHLDNY